MTPFEIVFVVFAAAFALEEYTASKEHGWDSKFVTLNFKVDRTQEVLQSTLLV